jgi:hypothetical protein
MQHSNASQNLSDAILTGSLVTAPTWAAWLAQINQLLTTLSLVLGLIVGTARLWRWWNDE